MSVFYTKEQIDAQGAHMATAISNKIREAVGKLPISTQSKFMGTYLSVEAIPAVDFRTFAPIAGSYVYVDGGADQPTELYLWDEDTQEFVKSHSKSTVAESKTVFNHNTGNRINIWIGTQTEYDAVVTKDSDTLYMVK